MFITPKVGALLVTGLPGPPARSSAAYLTSDGGRTWVPVRLPRRLVPAQVPDFADAQHGFLLAGKLGRDGTLAGQALLYATSAGGATWTERSANPLPSQAVLDFVTPAIGFGTVISYPPYRAYLLTTSNGGGTWTAITARLTSPLVRSSQRAPLQSRSGRQVIARPPQDILIWTRSSSMSTRLRSAPKAIIGHTARPN